MNPKRFTCLFFLFILAIVFVIVSILLFIFVGQGITFIANAQETSTSTDVNNEAFPKSQPYVPKKQEVIKSEPKVFKLFISKLDLSEEVILNVNPTIEEEYLPVIDKNIAHGRWTYTPDMAYLLDEGITYLFAHKEGDSKGGIFNRLSELGDGDEIVVQYNGNYFVYQLVKKQIVTPEQTDIYTSTSDEPMLRLQTCENGEKERLIVDARLIKVY